ncbi:helix-turn-helix domain-containing protein [Streptomyces sulfonofaciens]|uniref:helix-turn-helix domain-containing protein n=1 Tax=Streptomyces sulfonofaciens TaxID=68272 RepID=UPI001E524412|nr:helix-turn-helix domain-containing protein [Streptomyces sulfonofaciens]
MLRHLLVLRLVHLYRPGNGVGAGNDVFRRLPAGGGGQLHPKPPGGGLCHEPPLQRSHPHPGHAGGHRGRGQTSIDERVLLEARRLLVHTELAASAIGERLGFPSATVFTKFFRQRAGRTPAAFRASERGTGS